MYVYTRKRPRVLQCAREARVYRNKYVKRMYIYIWWSCKCVYLCMCVNCARLFIFVCVHVYHNNSMYTILSRIMLIAHQASLLSDGIKSEISKLAKKKRKKNHVLVRYTYSHCFLFFFINQYSFWTSFLFSLLTSLAFKFPLSNEIDKYSDNRNVN